MIAPGLASTVKEVREYLNSNVAKGTTCPCCDQTVKMYPNKITGYMASILIKYYKRGFEWVHPIEEFKTINGDYAKLRHWGLTEKSSEVSDPDKKSNGKWRITQKGVDFVEGNLKISQTAMLYNNKCWGFKGKHVSIREALGTKFNFQELMNS
jgi:hypothetical protein